MASKRRQRSPVWNYFSRSEDTSDEAKCSVCGDSIKTSKNTSNMIKHLKSKHLSEYQVVIAEKNADKQAEPASKQPTLRATLKRSVTYDSESFRKRKIDDALIKMIALDLQPASVVEDTGFRHLVHTLDPRYQLPSRRSLMRSQLPDVYEKIKANLKERISKVQFCSITTDLWTSRTTESYITVTCHFVKERVLQSVILETWHVPEAHTGDNLAAELKRIAQLWEIDEKIVGVVTDSAANIVLAVAKNRWKHLSCFAHVLNLVVQHAIKADSVVSDILKNVELSLHFFIKVSKAARSSNRCSSK